MTRLYIIFLFTFLLLSCSDKPAPIVDPTIYGHEYFPLEVGKYRIYEVDSLQFDLGQGDLPVVDSSHFFMRVETVDQFDDQTGETVFRIERYRAEALGDPWVIMDVVTESRTTNQAFHTENNLRFIPLVFPLRENLEWDGLAFIPNDIIIYIKGEALEIFDNWQYRVLSTKASEKIGTLDFEDVATIQQVADTNIVELRYGIEKYAANVGLVYRERQMFDSFCKYIGETQPCIQLSWREKAGRGYLIREFLIDYN